MMKSQSILTTRKSQFLLGKNRRAAESTQEILCRTIMLALLTNSIDMQAAIMLELHAQC
jgi:hypothetical protein